MIRQALRLSCLEAEHLDLLICFHCWRDFYLWLECIKMPRCPICGEEHLEDGMICKL